MEILVALPSQVLRYFHLQFNTPGFVYINRW
jgi:hypothetical protein